MMDTTPDLQVRNNPERLLLLGLLLLAFGLRVYAIDASSLWSDEGNTWALMGRSFSQIGVDSAADIHPPGYYWLLKIWTSFSGESAAALRLFSAFAGTAVVLVIYRLGRLIDRFPSSRFPSSSLYALLAALIAAVNPLQIFYSQEARMYMPLALTGSLLALALCQILRAERDRPSMSLAQKFAPYALYVFSGLCGLWIHYSFPICLAAVGLTYLAHTGFDRTSALRQRYGGLLRYVVANLLIILGYLPWLRIGIERVINWPKGGESVSVVTAIDMLVRTFVVGPLRDRMGHPLEVHGAWLLGAGILPIVGLIVLYLIERRSGKDGENGAFRGHPNQPPLMTILLSAWLFLPLIVMLGFGLFSEAFLKFLLVAAPAWSLALAAVPLGTRLIQGGVVPSNWGRWLGALGGLGMGIVVLVFSWLTLPTYYANPLARDNYAGVARYIDASVAEDSTGSLVVLNAPGQQEVWRYYESGLPTLALPTQRPIDEQETINLLAEKIPAFNQIFALFWATDEADPNSVVERWLDQQAYKAFVSWQGNVRFVRYDLPNDLRCRRPDGASALFGSDIELMQLCLQDGEAGKGGSIRAGEVLPVGLRWQTSAVLESRYKVAIQLLDERDQVIGQRDSEPGGGSMPTVGWQPNTTVVDNYGIVVPPGTPPGVYRLIVAMYDDTTWQRLPTTTGDHLVVGSVEVVRPDRAMPHEVVPMGQRSNRQMGSVILAGYDLYRKGYAHEPNTPVGVGDLVHVTLYWQAPTPLPADWPADLQVTMRLGNERFSSSLVRAEYPTAMWQSGEFVRGEFDILFDGSADRIVLEVDGESIELHPVP